MNHDKSRRTRRAAGCVVYQLGPSGAPSILLIHDKYGQWTLPKGHLHDGESEEAAAAREVLEETGIHGQIGALVTRIDYSVRTKRGELRPKQVAFFLMRASGSHITPQADEGIDDAGWFAPATALAMIGYPQVRDVLAQALLLPPLCQ
jgi:8-oxo-dGTP diphosphatase